MSGGTSSCLWVEADQHNLLYLCLGLPLFTCGIFPRGEFLLACFNAGHVLPTIVSEVQQVRSYGSILERLVAWISLRQDLVSRGTRGECAAGLQRGLVLQVPASSTGGLQALRSSVPLRVRQVHQSSWWQLQSSSTASASAFMVAGWCVPKVRAGVSPPVVILANTCSYSVSASAWLIVPLSTRLPSLSRPLASTRFFNFVCSSIRGGWDFCKEQLWGFGTNRGGWGVAVERPL